MPRVSEKVDDRTPLTASRLDVAARIGWLLRTHRSVAGLSLRQMSVALREHEVSLSAATLSRIETEGQRSPAALDGYARVLGLPVGALSTPVDLLCRSFPYAPPAPAEPAAHDLDRFTRACEAVDVASPTGGAWLEFARQHADDARFGLPRTLMEPLVCRLSLELNRAVGTARFTRHQALGQLAGGAYGAVVEATVRAIVHDPAAQNFWDLVDVLGERATPSSLEWVATLLRDPSIYRMRGASYALQAMLVVGGLDLESWARALAHVQQACLDARADPERTAVLAQLCAAVPARLRALVPDASRPEHGEPQGPTVWSRSRRNLHYVLAESAARAACARRGQSEEPLLARLLFEAMFDLRGVRMSGATVLLAFSPFAADLVQVLLEERDTYPDEVSRTAALRVAAFCHVDGDLPGTTSLVASADPTEFQHALTMLSRGTQPLPRPALDRGLSGDEMTVRRTLCCLGMLGDPALAEVAADPSRPEEIRAGARWWADQGGRILV